PDIEVNRAKLSDEKLSNTFKEADLAGHLSNGNAEEDSKNSSKEKPESEASSEEEKQKQMLAKDFQLQEALNLLKALDILKYKDKQRAELSDTKTESKSMDSAESGPSAD